MILTVLTITVVAALMQFIHLLWVMRWSERNTHGGVYDARSPRQRRRFRRILRFHALLLWPILKLLAAIDRRPFRERSFHYRETAGPLSASPCETPGPTPSSKASAITAANT